MLRCLVLCLAAALASGFDEKNPPMPVFSSRFTMRLEHMNYLTLKYLPITVWFDGHVKKSRIDTEDVKRVFSAPSKDFKYGIREIAYPTTTETNAVKLSCVYSVGDQANPVVPEAYLPLFRKGFNFIGKERVHDRDAYVWRYTDNLFGITMNFETVVAYTGEANDRNEASAIPLREKWRFSHDESGSIGLDYINDFYDYQPLEKIDPDIWNIHEGITCKESNETEMPLALKFRHNMDAFYQFLDLLGNHEDRNTQTMTNFFKKYIERRIGHKFELTDSAQSSTAMYEGPPAGPNNALPFPYSEFEIEEMSRDLPVELDWRVHGAVTPVKDGMDAFSTATWAFSATGVIEGYHYLKTGMSHIIWMSEQVLIDCSWGFGNNGIDGGRPEYAFEWVKKYGIPSGIGYRAFNGLDNTCNLTGVPISANITGYTRVPQSEKALKVALHTYGPVSAEIRAGFILAGYEGGIFKEECNSKKTVFVLIVGYGVLNGEKYWIIKNSFGTDWGDNGYMYLAMENNLCGVQDSVYYVQ